MALIGFNPLRRGTWSLGGRSSLVSALSQKNGLRLENVAHGPIYHKLRKIIQHQ